MLDNLDIRRPQPQRDGATTARRMRSRTVVFLRGVVTLIVIGGQAEGQTGSQRHAAPYTLSGVVIGQDRSAVPSAEVTVSQNGRTLEVAITNEGGNFKIENLSAGQTSILARRLGYKPRSAILNIDGSEARVMIEITLEAVPVDAGSVVVTGSSNKLSQFYDARRHNGFGQFFDREQIEKRHIRFPSELLRTVSGASVRPSSRFGNLVRLRGCRPKIWLDRVPLDVELDDVTTPEEIAGIEIYPSSPAVPPQYMDSRGCGVIVVWTRG